MGAVHFSNNFWHSSNVMEFPLNVAHHKEIKYAWTMS